MDIKKKLIISISSLCLVLMLALFTLVAVFAAENQSVSSQIDITYRATNISATITGEYLRKGDSGLTSMGAPIEFIPTDETGTRTMGVNGLELNEVKTYAILKYTFTNNSASVRINAVPTVTVSNSTNITTTYAVSTTNITNYDTITETSLRDFAVAQSGTIYVFVKIRITDLSSNANFNGTFLFDLSKTE